MANLHKVIPPVPVHKLHRLKVGIFTFPEEIPLAKIKYAEKQIIIEGVDSYIQWSGNPWRSLLVSR